jgi:hypothetical protein
MTYEINAKRTPSSLKLPNLALYLTSRPFWSFRFVFWSQHWDQDLKSHSLGGLLKGVSSTEDCSNLHGQERLIEESASHSADSQEWVGSWESSQLLFEFRRVHWQKVGQTLDRGSISGEVRVCGGIEQADWNLAIIHEAKHLASKVKTWGHEEMSRWADGGRRRQRERK